MSDSVLLISVGAMITVLALVCSCAATAYLVRSRGWLRVLDHPGERSLHNRPVPRTGGVAIVSAFLLIAVGISLYLHRAPLGSWWGSAAVFLVAIVSFADDRMDLTPGFRFVTHVVAAIFLILGGFGLVSLEVADISVTLVPSLAFLVTALFVVWMINLYNFMDGMDGFAGGMAVVGFGALAWIGWVQGGTALFVALNLVVAGTCLGFLTFNFPPARIFMGDVGSSTLGLLAAFMLLWAQREGIMPLWAGVLLFSPFIVDATVTLCRRIYRRERIWVAHRTHYYQRLVQLGWGHRRTVLWEYALMMVCATAVITTTGRDASTQWFAIALIAAIYVFASQTVLWLERTSKASRGSMPGRI